MDLPYPGIELGPPALQTDCLPTELPGMIIIIMAIMNSPAALAVCCWHPVGFSISNLPWEILVPLVLPSLGPLVTYQLESALESHTSRGLEMFGTSTSHWLENSRVKNHVRQSHQTLQQKTRKQNEVENWVNTEGGLGWIRKPDEQDKARDSQPLK